MLIKISLSLIYTEFSSAETSLVLASCPSFVRFTPLYRVRCTFFPEKRLEKWRPGGTRASEHWLVFELARVLKCLNFRRCAAGKFLQLQTADVILTLNFKRNHLITHICEPFILKFVSCLLLFNMIKDLWCSLIENALSFVLLCLERFTESKLIIFLERRPFPQNYLRKKSFQ